MAKPKRVLTEAEWEKVFQLRCKSKQGQSLNDDERSLIEAAFKSDKARYSAMDGEVFNATVPAGSFAKWRG